MADGPGDGRLCGVEIEFAGLDAAAAADIVAAAVGGAAERTDTHAYEVRGGTLGKLKIELDTALAKTPENPSGLDKLIDGLEARGDAAKLLADVLPVPVELVTEPIARADFAALDRVLDALGAAGAIGTKGATLYAFGMHLNPAHSGSAAAAIRIAAGYAFAEEWVREVVDVDNARRATPFVDPYPASYLRALTEAFAEGEGPDLAAFITLYGASNPDRNRGLDLWPLLAHLDAEEAARHHRGPIKGARPAFHWRLPESRLGAPDWSPLDDLDLWERIEAAALDSACLEEMRRAAAERLRGAMSRVTYTRRIERCLR